MHDYHEAVKMVEESAAKAQQNGWSKVTKIKLAIGDASTYSEDVIRTYFEEESKGKVCEGADIEVRHIKTRFLCPNCNEMFDKRPFDYTCPKCGTEGNPTSVGTEMDIEEIQGE